MTSTDLNDFFLPGSSPPSFDTSSSPKQPPQSHPTTYSPIPIHTHPFDSPTAASESWPMYTCRQSILVQVSWNRCADVYQREPGSIIDPEDQWGENGELLNIGGGSSGESQSWYLDELRREIPEQTGMEVSTQPAHHSHSYGYNANLASISSTPLPWSLQKSEPRRPLSSKEPPSRHPHHRHVSQCHRLFLDGSGTEKKDQSRNSSLDAQWSGSPRVSPLGSGGRGFQPPQGGGGGEREWREYLFRHMGPQEEGRGGEEIVQEWEGQG